MPTVRAAVKPPARILVVEDDYSIREALSELLAEEGYHVTCASNGAEALHALSGDAAPSLILLDLMMPVMDGWQFRTAQRLDPRLSSIQVLVLSASHGGGPGAPADLDAEGFLPKPFDVDTLVSAVHRLC
jgi:CheY-like chemotaxis protein